MIRRMPHWKHFWACAASPRTISSPSCSSQFCTSTAPTIARTGSAPYHRVPGCSFSRTWIRCHCCAAPRCATRGATWPATPTSGSACAHSRSGAWAQPPSASSCSFCVASMVTWTGVPSFASGSAWGATGSAAAATCAHSMGTRRPCSASSLTTRALWVAPRTKRSRCGTCAQTAPGRWWPSSVTRARCAAFTWAATG